MQGLAKNCDDMNEQKGVLDNGHEIMAEFGNIRQDIFKVVNVSDKYARFRKKL